MSHLISTTPHHKPVHSVLIDSMSLKTELMVPIAKSLKSKKKFTGKEMQFSYTESRVRFGKILGRSISQDSQIITLLLDIFSIDDLEEMDRENAEIIRNTLVQFPKNVNKYKEFNGLKPLQVIELNKVLKKPTLSARTIKGMIQTFSSFCSWAVSHGYISTNHFYKLPTLPPKADDIRLSFNDEHLIQIFNMSDYHSWSFRHNYYYWLPLLLRLTGARLNELCQLWCDDVKEIDGIWCLIIHEKFKEQRVKNLHSARVIPIHPSLIERGFIKFVESLKTERIFDELKAVKGYYSHNASKWFARRRLSLGFGKGLDAHSFRHSFAAELKRKEVSKEKIEELLGHSHNSISMDLYGKKYRPSQLLEVIELIDDSHLSHIKPYFYGK